MKKCYKAPEVVVIDLDCKEIMSNLLPGSNGGQQPDPDTPAEGCAASYRSSLWND